MTHIDPYVLFKTCNKEFFSRLQLIVRWKRFACAVVFVLAMIHGAFNRHSRLILDPRLFVHHGVYVLIRCETRSCVDLSFFRQSNPRSSRYPSTPRAIHLHFYLVVKHFAASHTFYRSLIFFHGSSVLHRRLNAIRLIVEYVMPDVRPRQFA